MLLRAEITDHSVADSEGSSPSAPPPVLYHLKVWCRHSGGHTEEWTVQRNMEDFGMLYSIVEQQVLSQEVCVWCLPVSGMYCCCKQLSFCGRVTCVRV